jgi:hypothetical protein
MSEDVLPYEIEGSVAMDEIARNDELRAVILTGTGQAFARMPI